MTVETPLKQFAGPLVAVLFAVLPAPATCAESEAERALRQNRIDPTVDGIRKYLRLLTPNDVQRKKAVDLVAVLGAAEYQVRESATRALTRMPHPPMAELGRAAKSPDPEVRWRANRILRRHKERDVPLMLSVLTVIARKPLRGLAPEVLTTFAHLEKPYGTSQAARALRATAEKSDAALLRKALASEEAIVRAAAVETLAALLGDAVLRELQPILASRQQPEEVRLAAARAFAEAGRREAVDVLVELMASPDVSVRAGSAVLLRALTGRRFAYAAYDTSDRRTAALRRWVSWVSAEGKTAALKHPLKLFTAGESYLNGHTLISYGYRNKFVELDGVSHV